MKLVCNSFENGAAIPHHHGRLFGNIPPSLVWEDVPDNAVSLVLFCLDPDALAGIWTHWVVYNIPKNNNGSLLQTLKVFLLMDRNQKRTAEALHLHRNSLRYRLNQIEEIFGSDIFSGFKLQKLFFALITYTLLDDEVLI